jgi:hypothetical protein
MLRETEKTLGHINGLVASMLNEYNAYLDNIRKWFFNWIY